MRPVCTILAASFWLALLLMNEELIRPGLDIAVPDMTKACPMCFSWTANSARKREETVLKQASVGIRLQHPARQQT